MSASSRTSVKRVTAAAAIAGAVCAMAACGASPSSDRASGTDDNTSRSSQSWSGLTGAEREAALVKAAKEEGTLMVYSAFNDEQAMADAFTKKYDIPVKVYNGNSETVLQRVVQETGADKLGNDVLVAPAADLQALDDSGVLGHYSSEYRNAVSDKGKGADWTGVRRLAFVAAWNSKNVADRDVPTDYADFSDPVWKGRISMEYADIDWYAALSEHYRETGMSDDEIDELFEGLAANAKIVKGHTSQGELLAAGQFDVALSLYTQTIDRAKKDGAPVSYGDDHPMVGPVVVRYDAGAVMKGAQHPAGAALYLDFELSQPGFDADRELGALPPVASPDDPTDGADIVEQDVPRFVEERQEIAEKYDDLVNHH